VTAPVAALDRDESAQRIHADVALLARPPFSASASAVCRYPLPCRSSEEPWTFPGPTATVGELDLEPSIVNVIPLTVRMSLDVRAGENTLRDHAFDEAAAAAREACVRRGLEPSQCERQRFDAMQFDSEIAEALATAA
jgi:beta-ureidopropionase / N-carbamoyl-L-amino-acid hydrolase